jgi:hypothetical protein
MTSNDFRSDRRELESQVAMLQAEVARLEAKLHQTGEEQTILREAHFGAIQAMLACERKCEALKRALASSRRRAP